MKFNKRLLSFFLAVLMLVSTFSGSVFAESNDLNTQDANTESSVTATKLGGKLKGKVEGDKEVFTFDLSKFKSAESEAPMNTKAMPARAPRSAPVQWDTEVNITTIGLNKKAFDWTALPNKEFKLIAKWETTDGQKCEKEITTITNTSDTKQFANVGWPVDGTMKGNASVVTNYNGNIEVRIAIVSASGIGGSGRLTFDITLTELAEPRVNIEYVDPYGRPINDQADLPSATDTMPKVTAEELTDVEIGLPKAKGQINMRNSGDIDDDELNTAESGLTYNVDGKANGETVKIGKKEYKLDISTANAKQIGTIKMVYQKDVVIPPTKDDGTEEPVEPAEGYVRLTFDANEDKADGITGTHTEGAYKGQQKSYIDVKEGLDYTNDNLQAAIKALSTTGTKLVGTETKKYAQDAKKPWTPVVPTDTTPVTIATYNAQYAKSAAEQVTELGGLNPVTIKVWKGDKIDWADGVAPATTNSNDSKLVQQLLDNAKVTDQSSRNSDAQGKFEGKLLVTFKDKSTLEVDKQWLYVWEHIVTVDPNNTDPDAPKVGDLPSDKIIVKFVPEKNGGVKSIKTTGTTYVKPGTKFEDKDFPTNITFQDGYKGPVTWSPANEPVTTNSKSYDSKRNTFAFKASAIEAPAVIVNPTDPTPKAGYVRVTFKKGSNGTLSVTGVAAKADGSYEFDVLKTKTWAELKAANPALTVPTITAEAGWTVKAANGGWDKALPSDGDKLDANKEFTAQYEEGAAVIVNPTDPTPKAGYVRVTFKKGSNGTLSVTGVAAKADGSYEFDVLKTKTWAELKAANPALTVPTITAEAGWTVKAANGGWDKALPSDGDKLDANKEFTAQYEEGAAVIVNPTDPTPKAGYVRVTFKKGSNGTLSVTGVAAKADGSYEFDVLKTKTWAELKAANPALTVPTITAEAGWTVKAANGGWDKALPSDGDKLDANKEFTAQYEEGAAVIVNPTDPTPKAGYVRVTFKKGSNGTLSVTGVAAKADGSYEFDVLKTKTWAELKAANPALTVPTITAEAGWTVKAANGGWDKALPSDGDKLDANKEFTAQYEEGAAVIVNPTDPTPKAGYVRVTFKKGSNGTLSVTGVAAKADGSYEFDVLKTKTWAELKAANPALTVPTITAEAGWTVKAANGGWDKALPSDGDKLDANKEFTAQYEEGAAVIVNPTDPTPKAGYVRVTFKKGSNGTLSVTGVAAKADGSYEFDVLKTKTWAELKAANPALTVPTITAEAGWTVKAANGGWDKALPSDGDKLDANKEFTAQYEEGAAVIVNPTDPTPKAGYVRVTFKKGSNGTLSVTGVAAKADGSYEFDVLKTKTWAELKAANPALTVPTITAEAGWTVKAANGGWDKALPSDGDKLDANKEFTAQYEEGAAVIVNPTDPTPKAGYVRVTFKKGSNGTLSVTGVAAKADGSYEFDVLKTKTWAELKAANPALTVPTITAEAGWTVKAANGGWDKALPSDGDKLDANKEFTAQYTQTDPGQQKSTPPSIDQPMDGDTIVTGSAKPNADVTVTLPNGDTITVPANSIGRWTVTSRVPLQAGEKVTAKATERGMTPSDEVWAYVSGNLTLTLDENYRGGEITHYDVYQGELIERYLYTPRRRGYVFEGWSYNSRRLDEVRPGDGIYYPTTLYAIWSKQKVKDDEDVEPVDTREVGEHKAYMFGYTDGTVRPNGYITRAEAAALVTRLLGLDTFASAAEPAFTDTPSSWYNKAINAAVQRGIMKGYPDGRFRPNAPITRAEFTQMISTIDNKPYGVAPFADVKGHWAERPIGSEYQAGRIKGYPDGTFRPNAFITRCEAVVILNKIFERNFDAMSLKDAKNAYLIKGFIDLPTSFWGYYDMIEATNSHSFKRRVKGLIQEDWVEVK